MSPKQELRRRAIFTLAFRDYAKSLGTRAYFKVHNKDTSDDLVQETFMKMWLYLVKNGKIDSMRAFLHHVLNNLIVDEYRKRRTTSLDLLFEKGYEPGVDAHERLIDVLDGAKSLQLIARLPLKYQKVLRMRYVDGLSLQEMAQLTGQSKNTVAVQAHRGLIKLKALREHQRVS